MNMSKLRDFMIKRIIENKDVKLNLTQIID